MVPELLQFTEHLEIILISVENHENIIFYANAQTGNNITNSMGTVLLKPEAGKPRTKYYKLDLEHFTCSSSLPSRFMARALILRPSFSLFS
jgi:hypothetical protein